MSNTIQRYKVFRSFRLKVLPEDRFSLSFIDRESPLPKNLQILDINFSGISLLCNQDLPLEGHYQFKIVRKKMLGKKTITVGGHISRKFYHDDFRQDAVAIRFDKRNKDEVASFLEDFILEFNTKRLKSYLADSSLEEKQFNQSDASEMLNIFFGLYKKLDFNSGQEKIKLLCESFISDGAILYAADYKEKILRPIISTTSNMPKEILKKNFSFRSGIPGMSFNTKEVIHFSSVYNSDVGPTLPQKSQLKNSLTIPICGKNGERLGVLQLLNSEKNIHYRVSDEHLLKMLANSFAQDCLNFNAPTQEQIITTNDAFNLKSLGFVGESPFSEGLRKIFRRYKDTLSPLLITGENGTGRVKLAKIIHSEGINSEKQLIHLDPIKLTAQVFIEKLNELLSISFSGTLLVENSLSLTEFNQKTLFNIAKNLEARIIFIESHMPVRLADKWDLDLQRMVGTHHIHYPPLRLRKSDILPYANYFIQQYCKQHNLKLKILSQSTMESFKQHNWPENVRELKKTIFHACQEQRHDQILNIEIDPIEKEEMLNNIPLYLAKIADNGLSLEKQSRILKIALSRLKKPTHQKVS